MITHLTKPYTQEAIRASLTPLVNGWFQDEYGTFSPPQQYSILNIKKRKHTLISSPTGSGKCVTPDTPIIIQEKGMAKLITAGELIERTQGKKPDLKVDSTGELHRIKGMKSYSFNGHFIEEKPAHIYHESYEGEIITIRTLYGRSVSVSPEHPLLVDRDGTMTWVPAKHITTTDRIGVPRKIDLPEQRVSLPVQKALKVLKTSAQRVIDYAEYLRLRRLTKEFTDFDVSIEDRYRLLLLAETTLTELASDLHIGLTTAYCLLQKKTVFGREKLNVWLTRLQNITLHRHEVIIQTRAGRVERFRYPTTVDERVARWTAFVTSEGFIGEYETGASICISQKNRLGLLSQVLADTKSLFNLEFMQRNTLDYVIASTNFALFVSTLLGISTGRGRGVPLPNWLLNCTAKQKAVFLQTFFSLEAEVNKRSIVLTQANKQKIELINYLLLSIGVFASMGEKRKYASNTAQKTKRTYYSLSIHGIENIARFLRLEFVHPRTRSLRQFITRKPSGKQICKHALSYKKIGAVARQYASYAAFSSDFEHIYEVTRRTGYITEDAMRGATNLLMKQGFAHNHELILEFDEHQARNLVWLPVTTIDVQHYRGKLVDLSVPGLENFVGGSGAMYLHNTLSAFLAVLDDLARLSQDEQLEDRVYCVYVSPLKALGNDIEKNLERPLQALNERNGEDLGIRVGVRTGDTSAYERQKMLKKPPHILITTPESLAIMLTSPKFSQLLHGIDWMIIDEIHALADNKRGTHLALVLERLSQYTEYTRIGLSATVAPLQEVGRFLAGDRPCDVVDVQYTKELDIQVLSPVPNVMSATHQQLADAQYELLNKLIGAHQTTLIFTNTRAATERVVHNLKERYPTQYSDDVAAITDESDETGDVRTSIAAHHGSLSKEHRLAVEERLRDGTLKCVVSSTSLELGIDIGYVDLVVLLGSPKSVARALQRIGRSGHKLHATAKGRIIVLDRDDLVECAVLAKHALEKHIDTIHIPENCLDVLAQEVYAHAIMQQTTLQDLYATITRAHPYRSLTRKQLRETVEYLAGEHASLEERHVYAKIWYDKDTGTIGRKGKMARVLYQTNVGTIPDQTTVIVKIGEAAIGSISEPFLESLKKGDVFVLGGDVYEFKYSRGMTAQVRAAHGKKPTVPSWFSEMLPLSYDLAVHVQHLRKYVRELFEQEKSTQEVLEWITSYLPVDQDAATSIYEYAKQQHLFSTIPHHEHIVIEYFTEKHHTYTIFHTVFGRRVNDVLSRAVAFAAQKMGSGDIEVGITDNGFYFRHQRPLQAKRALVALKPEELREVMNRALEKSEVLTRRFRHCAGRGLMILRNYKGHKKSVGKQQVSSRILMSAVKRLPERFPIYQEAVREVLEDKMDFTHAQAILERIQTGRIKVTEEHTQLPSPFAFSLVLQGYADVMRVEERQEFLRRLHQEVLAKIALGKHKQQVHELVTPEDFSYQTHWQEEELAQESSEQDQKLALKEQLYLVARKTGMPAEFVYETQRLIEGEREGYPQRYINWLSELLTGTIPKQYPDELVRLLKERLPEIQWR